MLLRLFLIFTIIPFLELYFLIKIGTLIGALNTIIVVIITAFIGALLTRFQGLQAMIRVRDCLNRGDMPAEELLDALLIFLAGIVLLTPGFITDLAGFLILIPKTRSAFKQWLRKKIDNLINRNRIDITFRG